LHIVAIETEERKDRIAAGNKVFYANKMHIYKSLIRPVTYGCEAWLLKDIHERQLKSV